MCLAASLGQGRTRLARACASERAQRAACFPSGATHAQALPALVRPALQQAAELLPSISGLLAGISLPTIPLVNFDLDSIKTPVMDASDQLQGLLADSEGGGGASAAGPVLPQAVCHCERGGTGAPAPPSETCSGCL